MNKVSDKNYRRALHVVSKKIQAEQFYQKSLVSFDADMQQKPDENGPFAVIYGGKYPAINISRIIYEGWICGIRDRELVIEFARHAEKLVTKKLESVFRLQAFGKAGADIRPELEPFWNTESAP